MSDDIKKKLDDIENDKNKLESCFKVRKEKLDKCLELQLFLRDCENAEQWMKNRENALNDDASTIKKQNDLIDSGAPSGANAAFEAAIKRHEDFDRAINAQEEKIKNLQIFANTLINNNHYDRDNIVNKINEVLDRWEKLRKALIDHRSKLGESQTLQDFSRDADEIEAWIAEKLQLTSEEPVIEASNIQVIFILINL